MRKNFPVFYGDGLKKYLEAVGNLFIFLPYFFSVTALLKTFFYPWKNLVIRKTRPGFSFDDWINRLFFNTISRSMGFFMRLSILTFYLLFQISLILLLPFITIVYLVVVPMLYLESLFQKTPDERKKILHDQFCTSHLLLDENSSVVEQWFESYYQKHCRKTQWWKLSNLFSLPPLARDWAVGYTPTLDQYVEDLTGSTYQLQRPNIVDRQKEIGQIEEILSKSEEANVVIVGEEGVGKHTVVDALAKKIYEGKTNVVLMYKRVLKLNMEYILSQYTDRSQREHFIDTLLAEAAEAKNCILLIENVEKYLDYSTSLQKFAKTTDLQIIGITTPFAYQKFIMNDDKLHRLFTIVDVYEIKEAEAGTILLDNAYLYEQKHRVHIPYETVHEIIQKSGQFVTSIPFPEKALHLMDTVCAYTNQKRETLVLPEYVDEILTQETHIPVSLTSQMKEKLVTLESLLASQIVQQSEAIRQLSSALRRSLVLFGKRKKPLASFLFLGPTGVGKTFTAKAICQIFFGDDTVLNRFDMSLYQKTADIEKLIGSQGNINPGLLTMAIREHPYGVLLLDEIEKVDSHLINIFLTMLDEGYITDGSGKKVDCKNLVIIATSNAAAAEIYMANQDLTENKLIDYLVQKHLFSPEFLNRFDGIITFQALDSASILTIARTYVGQITKDLCTLHKVTLKVSDEYLKAIIEKGYDPKFGARHMERLIRSTIEDKVAKLILENKAKAGDIIQL